MTGKALEARDALITENRGLVGLAVSGFRRARIDWEDLESEAVLALVEAATHYRSELGPFSSYALPRIRFAIVHAIARDCSPGSGSDYDLDLIPDRDHEEPDYDRLWEAVDRLPDRARAIVLEAFSLTDRDPDRAAIAKRNKISEKTVTRIKNQALETLRESLSA